jgi:hypothetical protein
MLCEGPPNFLSPWEFFTICCRIDVDSYRVKISLFLRFIFHYFKFENLKQHLWKSMAGKVGRTYDRATQAVRREFQTRKKITSELRKLKFFFFTAPLMRGPAWGHLYAIYASSRNWRREAKSFFRSCLAASTQNVHHLLWKPKIHYRVHKSQPLASVLGPISPQDPTVSLSDLF